METGHNCNCAFIVSACVYASVPFFFLGPSEVSASTLSLWAAKVCSSDFFRSCDWQLGGAMCVCKGERDERLLVSQRWCVYLSVWVNKCTCVYRDLWVRDKCERATLTVSITEAWCEGTVRVRTQEQQFHHPKARWERKKTYKDAHPHLDDSVPLHWSAINAWKDTGNPVLYHTQKRKRKWDLHQSIKGRAQAGESLVEMAAADNATPVIITRGLLSLFSTGKHIHMTCLTEQRSSVSHRGLICIFSERSQWGLFEHSYDKRLCFFKVRLPFDVSQMMCFVII